MKKLMTILATGALVVGCTTQGEMGKPAEKNMSHMHMGHVLNGWNETPENAGLLPTAHAEAEIAAKHAGLTASKLDDLAWMKTHTLHVIHAIDPGKTEKGPGLGYGVIKAANGVAKHVNLAASSGDASDNVKNHAVHVSMTANNTAARATEILVHADNVLQATSAREAATHVTMMNTLAQQLLAGVDANGDGEISWHEGEGGLVVAAKHMGAMSKAEGINVGGY